MPRPHPDHPATPPRHRYARVSPALQHAHRPHRPLDQRPPAGDTPPRCRSDHPHTQARPRSAASYTSACRSHGVTSSGRGLGVSATNTVSWAQVRRERVAGMSGTSRTSAARSTFSDTSDTLGGQSRKRRRSLGPQQTSADRACRSASSRRRARGPCCGRRRRRAAGRGRRSRWPSARRRPPACPRRDQTHRQGGLQHDRMTWRVRGPLRAYAGRPMKGVSV